MADHGTNYKRMTGPKGEEIGTLGPECGHHCGVLTSGGTNKHVGHCPKNCCHGTPMNEVDPQFTMQSGGVDPRGIR